MFLRTVAKSLLLAAVVHTFLGSGEHLIHIYQWEHGQRSKERARLDGDAAPQQPGVTSFMKQGPDHHLQVGEEADEKDPGDNLKGEQTYYHHVNQRTLFSI